MKPTFQNPKPLTSTCKMILPRFRLENRSRPDLEDRSRDLLLIHSFESLDNRGWNEAKVCKPRAGKTSCKLALSSTFEFHPESRASILVLEGLALIGQIRPRGFKNRTWRQCNVIGWKGMGTAYTFSCCQHVVKQSSLLWEEISLGVEIKISFYRTWQKIGEKVLILSSSSGCQKSNRTNTCKLIACLFIKFQVSLKLINLIFYAAG